MGNFERKENSKGAEIPREPPGDSVLERQSREGRGGGGEISPMKTVHPGFLAMGAGSRRRRPRHSGREDALTPRRVRGLASGGRRAERATEATGWRARLAHGKVGRCDMLRPADLPACCGYLEAARLPRADVW